MGWLEGESADRFVLYRIRLRLSLSDTDDTGIKHTAVYRYLS